MVNGEVIATTGRNNLSVDKLFSHIRTCIRTFMYTRYTHAYHIYIYSLSHTYYKHTQFVLHANILMITPSRTYYALRVCIHARLRTS